MLPLVESLSTHSPGLPFHFKAFGRPWWVELERTPSAEGTGSPVLKSGMLSKDHSKYFHREQKQKTSYLIAFFFF